MGEVSAGQILKFVVKPFDSVRLEGRNVYKTHPVTSILNCGSICGLDSKCLAFYVTANPMTSSSRDAFQCWFLSQRLDDTHDQTNGVGTYGYLSELTVYPTPPQPFSLGGGVFQKITRTHHGPAAVFDCSDSHPSMTDLALLNTGGDSDTTQWPNLSSKCSSSICSQLGLAGTLLNISKGSNPDTFNVKPICKQGETFYSDAHCDNSGQWTFTTQTALQVACVPTACYRQNGIGRGVYMGTLAVSDLGNECQTWDAMTPSDHNQYPKLFVEEGKDRTAVKNYCRDPDNAGRPWCYQMTYTGSQNWQYCDIHACVGGFV